MARVVHACEDQRGHDAFLERHVFEAEQAVVVRNGDVLSTPNVLRVSVNRAQCSVSIKYAQ